MSAVLPDGKVDKLQFCEAHIAPLTANAVAVGTTSAAVSDLATKTAACRAAFDAQQAAQNAAKAATNDFNLAVRIMARAMADVIKSVKAKAAVAGDSIYSLAEIPVPQLPGPIGPLAKPTDFKATLSESGSLEIGWKCTQPRGATGTTYQVFRRIGLSGEFVFIGATGTKSFIDETLPLGSSTVTYQIRAMRSTSLGPWAQFNVNFGVPTGTGGGAMTASVVEGVPAKIAA